DATCAQSIIRDFGRKAYRRPLTDDETQSYIASFNDSGGGFSGLKRVFVRLLLNPALTYHVELGQSTSADSRIRLTDYEIASRISYATTGSMPDDALFQAAGRGELQSLDNVRAHVTRLMAADSRARAQVDDFFRIFLQIDPTRVPEAPANESKSQG